jgi:hypothetical protein
MPSDSFLWTMTSAVVVLAGSAILGAEPAPGPLRVSVENPRCFVDPKGKAVFLAGAHDGWELQDYAWGDANAPVKFDWDRFLDFLVEYNHNVIRLWCVESTKIGDDDADLTTPMAYERVGGRGKAKDGGDKFDLDRFNPAYFDRLRGRTAEAGERGIYVIVMLFQGWSIESKRGRVNPWPYHPFNRENNVNGLDGDPDGDGQGKDVHSWLGDEHPVTRRQRAYVRKVIDTLGDLDNVLYEIANESHNRSLDWQGRMVEFIHECEGARPKQHPVGVTVTFGDSWQAGLNELLAKSPAEWISPNREAAEGYSYRDNPPPNDGSKVVLTDTDHYYGNKCKDYSWAWKSFCRGHNLLYMDMWTVERDDAKRQAVRRALGHVRGYANRMDLLGAAPRGDLSSTKFCLAAAGREFLVYAPYGGPITLDLSDALGEISVEWFDPKTGVVENGARVTGGSSRTFSPPFHGDALLYLKVKENGANRRLFPPPQLEPEG